ncbi:hypothetical protein D9M72_596890 [compost metagenome]
MITVAIIIPARLNVLLTAMQVMMSLLLGNSLASGTCVTPVRVRSQWISSDTILTPLDRHSSAMRRNSSSVQTRPVGL